MILSFGELLKLYEPVSAYILRSTLRIPVLYDNLLSVHLCVMETNMFSGVGCKIYCIWPLTSTAVKKGGLSNGDVGALYKYKNILINVEVDTASNISTILTFTDIIPSTKSIATFKVPDYNSGKLELQYFHDHATLTTAVALNQSPTIDVSATIGTPTIAIGVEAGYDSNSSNFTKYTAGISVTRPESSASIILGDKGDTIKASYMHHLDQLKRSAGVAEITRRLSKNENTFTVGGFYEIDHLTSVKAKLNNYGRLGALLQHEVLPKSLITISGEIDTKA